MNVFGRSLEVKSLRRACIGQDFRAYFGSWTADLLQDATRLPKLASSCHQDGAEMALFLLLDRIFAPRLHAMFVHHGSECDEQARTDKT